jgi:hypothetical protein
LSATATMQIFVKTRKYSHPSSLTLNFPLF